VCLFVYLLLNAILLEPERCRKRTRSTAAC